MARTFIIAETGACHGGSLTDAQALIHAAAQVHADAVKFQWTSDPAAMGRRRRIPNGQDTYAVLAFPVDWHYRLRDAARDHNLAYMCTVFLKKDIPVVAPYVAKFKVASLESQDAGFLAAHAEYGKPILLSTGCQPSVRELPARPRYPQDTFLLHCVSAYPCPSADANIAAIKVSGYYGFSDHTTSLLSGALAVACGATIIEKHLRLDTTSPDNPDYPHALAPADFTEYVRRIREAEVLLGDGIKRVMPSEESLLPHVVRGEP